MGAKTAAESSDLLAAPLEAFMMDAGPTPSCFGLVPQGSDELAKQYQEFYASTSAWVSNLRTNVANAGLTLGQSKINYDAADNPGESVVEENHVRRRFR
ncbi:hypothetical protein [Microtetraspora sp. NBRC 13810]|uniref:hypothetical protein n=1 Tax=Microtetraspora sp. NBRC 13810 TaxID=3030990 RepID=UPI002556FA98|nr:hypothetical protein [Microtetraspora sp. NBRC 13810]